MKRSFLLSLAIVLVLALIAPAVGAEAVDLWAKYDQPVTVTFAVNGKEDGFSWGDNIWTQAWKDKFNIDTKILWSTETDDAYNTKLSLAILSGDLPDYICTFNYNQFLQLVDANGAADITALFKDWAYPPLYENMNYDGISQSYGVIDGIRYGINTTGGMPTDTRLYYIRSDYLEKVGGKIPTTVEEVVALGKQFVDQGLAKYALPLTGKAITEGYSDVQIVANGYGAYPNIWVDVGNGIQYGSTLPGMETALDVYKDLYKGGYIDPAFATAVGDTLTAQILNGEVGILTGDFWIPTWPLPDLKDANGLIVDWTIVQALPSANNAAFKVQGGKPTGKMIAIRAGYDHPEAVMKLMNFRCAMLDDPNMADSDFQTVYNADGTKIDNHMRCPIREYFNFPYTNMYTSPDVTKAIDTGDESSLVRPHDHIQYDNVKNYLAAKKANDITGMNTNWANFKLFYGENSAFGGFYKNYTAGNYIFDATGGYESPDLARLWGSLSQYENNFYINYIGGTEPSTFQDFVDTWMGMGGELLTYELNHR